MPSVGQRVRVELDKAGYIRQIQFLGEPAPVEPPVGASLSVAEPVAPARVAPLAQDVRGQIITRLAVLNTATAILSRGSQTAQAWEVINVAELLETWVTRG
jgi:hypothetical protein